MTRSSKAFLRLLVLYPVLMITLSFAHGGEEKVLWDSWMVIRISGDEAGWSNSKISELTEEGDIRYRLKTASNLNMKRFGETIEISTEIRSLEDRYGRIVEMHQKRHMSDEGTIYDLEVNGREAVMILTTMGTPRKVPVEWGDHVHGTMGKWLLMKEKGLEPGTKLSFQTFAFDYGKIATATLEVIGMEETELLDNGKGTYLHLTNSVDAMPGMKVHEWLDDNYDVMKTSVSVMGLTIESFRTTKERAVKAVGAELKSDLVKKTILRSNVKLPRPHRLDSVLYRFKTKDQEQTIPPSFGDSRQEFLENDGRTAKVLICAQLPEKPQTRPITNPPPELLEYIEPNAFIQSDYPALKAKALEVVGEETDAWKAACLLEKFVHHYIKNKNHGTAFASAAEVFENPKGDCSEHSVLLTALCRAAGIPARVVFGYMYVSGIFGGHMWSEVWIGDQWYPIDAVNGRGRVGPTHITFTTSSLKNGGLTDAYANLIQTTGTIEITILEYTHGDKTVVVEKAFKD